MRTFRLLLLVLMTVLSVSSMAGDYEPVSKSSNIYKTLKKEYKIKQLDKVKYEGEHQTFYKLTDKKNINYLLSESGTLLVRGYHAVTELEKYESHMDSYFGWLEETPGAILVKADGAAYIITYGGQGTWTTFGSSGNTEHKGMCLKLSENTVVEGNLIKEQCYGNITTNDNKSYPIGYNFYDYAGRKMSVVPSTSLYTSGEYTIYQTIDKETGAPLWGAYNHRYHNEDIPAIYSNMKREKGAIYVKLHFYQDWVQYTPGRMKNEKAVYSSLEKSMMHKNLADAYKELTQKQEKGEEFNLVDVLVLFQALTDYYKDCRHREEKMLDASKSDKDWTYYYDDPSAEEILNFDNKSAVDVMDTFIGIYDKFMSIPNIGITSYLEEQKKACDLEKLYFSMYSRRHDVAVNLIKKKGQERDRRLQIERQQREEREQRQTEMLLNLTANLFGSISNAISSSSSSSSKSTQTTSGNRSYSNSGSTSSNSSSYNSSNTETREKEKVMKKCSRCNGTGRLPNVSIHNADGPKSYCSECGENVPKHTHLNCSTCKGTGEVFDRWK